MDQTILVKEKEQFRFVNLRKRFRAGETIYGLNAEDLEILEAEAQALRRELQTGKTK